MIQHESMLMVADNSGAEEVLCIHVVGSTRRRYARVGDEIIATVKSARVGGTVKRKEIVPCVVVRTRSRIVREDGSVVRFDQNAVVIVNKDGNPRGSRVFGPIPREIKNAKKGRFSKIASLAKEVV